MNTHQIVPAKIGRIRKTDSPAYYLMKDWGCLAAHLTSARSSCEERSTCSLERSATLILA